MRYALFYHARIIEVLWLSDAGCYHWLFLISVSWLSHRIALTPLALQDMWDLTPDTDLLKELPNDYTFETALADLIVRML